MGRPRNVPGDYSNPYYDPDKAHEYYMKHRRLQELMNPTKKKKGKKGRKKKAKIKRVRTKKAPKYSAAEKAALKRVRRSTEDSISRTRSTMQEFINRQQDLLDSASKADKAKIRTTIRHARQAMKAQIQKARDIYKRYRRAYEDHAITK